MRRLLAIALAGLAVFAPAAGAKVIVNGFGAPGTFGGQIGTPGGVAVNQTGNGGVPTGTTYVVDSIQNRVERFSASGVFERTWGQNVLGRDEKQLLSIAKPTGNTGNATLGSFTLTFGADTTAPITVSSNGSGTLSAPLAATVQAALAALPSLGAGNVSVSGGPTTGLTVRFIGSLSGTDVSQLSANNTGLPANPVTVTTAETGSGGNNIGFEICSLASTCQDGAATATTANGGDMNRPLGIAVNQSTGNVYVTDAGNNRIQEFDPVGNFIRAWGWDVIVPGAPGDVPGPNEQQKVTISSNTSGGAFDLSFGGQTTGTSGSGLSTFKSKILTNFTTARGTFSVGQTVVSNSFPAGTTITAIDNVNHTVTLSAGQTSGGTNISATISVPQLSWDASPAAVQTALEGLSSIGTGNVSVSSPNPGGGVIGGPYTVTFEGPFSQTDVSSLSAAETIGLTASSGAGAVRIETTVPGANSIETCTVATDCRTATSGGGVGQLSISNSSSGNLIVDASGNVWVPDPTNSRIQVFDSSGNFLKMVGGDVISDGAGGTGVLAPSSSTITSVTTTSRLFEVGQTVTSPEHPGEIQPGSKILSCSPSCVGATSIVLSKPTAASVTPGAQALSAAAGTGNVSSNETQTIASPSRKFALEFGGQTTGAVGTATWAANSTTLTNVNTTSGAFAIGEEVFAGQLELGRTITAIDNINHTMTLSGSVGIGHGTNAQILGLDIEKAASAAMVQARLESLSTIGSGNVSVSGAAGGPWAVTFQGKLAGVDVPLLGTGSQSSVSSANPGSLEVCSVAAECRGVQAASGTALGQFSNGPSGIAFDSTGNLFTIGSRVQKFDPAFSGAAEFGAATFPSFTSSAPEQVAPTQSGARVAFVVNNTTAGERQIVELDPSDASVKDISLAGQKLDNISGLAANDTTGSLYATTSSSSSPRRVLVLAQNPLPDPVIGIDPVSTKSETAATFSGSVDPQGGWVSCKFQYSTDQSTWTDVAAPACEGLDASGGSKPISQAVTGLNPKTHYFVRLSVSRPLTTGTTKTTATIEFDTDGPAPALSNVGSAQVTDTSALLVGTIDPRNDDTTYFFKWGPAPAALDHSTDVVDIGGGTTPKVVSQAISGLEPGTTYYLELHATNGAGESVSALESFTTRSEPLPASNPGNCPNEAIRQAQGSSHLPDCRAYELTTPGADAHNVNEGGQEESQITTAADGHAVAVCNFYPHGGEVPTGICGDFVSYRDPSGPDPSGWQPQPVAPPFCAEDLSTGVGAQGYKAVLSADLDHAIVSIPESASCPYPPHDPSAPLPSTNLYLETFPGASFDLLSPQPGFGEPSINNMTGDVFQGNGWATGNADFGHVVYASTGNETGTPGADGNFDKLFEFDHGALRLVSVQPNGEPFSTPSQPVDPGLGAVSANGDRIFFYNPNTGSNWPSKTVAPPETVKIYMRLDHQTTYEISKSECISSCGSMGYKIFDGATADGKTVLFDSTEKLTDDDNDPVSSHKDLYIYHESANPNSDPHNLTLLSHDNEPASGTGADVQGVLGMSSDGTAGPGSNAAPGNTVYFAAEGQIVAGAPNETGPKIYRWTWNEGSPTVAYLATLSPATHRSAGTCQGQFLGYKQGIYDDENNWWCGRWKAPVREVTPDGTRLMIDTAKRLDPVADSDSDRDVYVWNQSNGWRCVSCQPPGVASGGESTLKGAAGINLSLTPTSNFSPYLVSSDDGKRIFFTSRDELIPGDTNGTVRDVYEWNEGTLSLISSGTGTHDNLLISTTDSGNDVFFMTDDRLVGWDNNLVNDVYDARVGGGVPEPTVRAVCDPNAGACEEASSSAPPTEGAGSAQFQGPGNQVVQQQPKRKHKHRKHRKRHRHHKANHKGGRSR